jgi:hypothetical protein
MMRAVLGTHAIALVGVGVFTVFSLPLPGCLARCLRALLQHLQGCPYRP